MRTFVTVIIALIFKMQKLFFELIKVALGRLDCVDRAPLEDEWPELYRMAQQQGVVATSYQGVEKLFEFGLRGPQDLMLDWMSEAENSFDADVIDSYPPVVMRNPLKNVRWQKVVDQNQDLHATPTMQLLSLLVTCHEQFVYGMLTLRPLLDAYRLIHRIDGHFAAFANGGSMEQQLKGIGIYKFTQAVMWVMGESMGLEPALMLCAPLEPKGRFLLADIMGEGHGWKHWLKKLW